MITGGSRGLGRSLAKQLSSEGARVVLVARGKEKLDEVVEEIRNDGGEAFGIVADVADKSAVHAIAGQAAAVVGPIDVLIQNASSLGAVPLRLLLDTDCKDLEAVLQVNLIGPFRLAKILVGSMALRGTGLVVSVTSDASSEAYPRWGSYSISKAALDHMNRIFAAELDGFGVRFLSIDPGDMATQMHADAVPDADLSTLLSPDDAACRIVEIIRRAEEFPNGSRLQASRAGEFV